MHWKGAAEIVLASCTHYIDADDNVVEMDEDKVCSNDSYFYSRVLLGKHKADEVIGLKILTSMICSFVFMF